MKENTIFRCTVNPKQQGGKASFLLYLLLSRHGQTLEPDCHVSKTLFKGCHEVSLERETQPLLHYLIRWASLNSASLTDWNPQRFSPCPVLQPIEPHCSVSTLRNPVILAFVSQTSHDSSHLWAFTHALSSACNALPPAASLPKFCISFSRDLSSRCHDTPNGIGSLRSDLKSTMDCSITVKKHTCSCDCRFTSPLLSRTTFCSSNTKLATEAHTEHVCRMKGQSGWHILPVIILVNKKPLKGPSATSLVREPFPCSPRELWPSPEQPCTLRGI